MKWKPVLMYECPHCKELSAIPDNVCGECGEEVELDPGLWIEEALEKSKQRLAELDEWLVKLDDEVDEIEKSLKKLRADKHDDPWELLRKLEWSSYCRGPGSGYMCSGGDGPLVRACPICGNVDPSDPLARNNFIAEAHGHKKDCWMGTKISDIKPEE